MGGTDRRDVMRFRVNGDEALSIEEAIKASGKTKQEYLLGCVLLCSAGHSAGHSLKVIFNKDLSAGHSLSVCESKPKPISGNEAKIFILMAESCILNKNCGDKSTELKILYSDGYLWAETKSANGNTSIALPLFKMPRALFMDIQEGQSKDVKSPARIKDAVDRWQELEEIVGTEGMEAIASTDHWEFFNKDEFKSRKAKAIAVVTAQLAIAPVEPITDLEPIEPIEQVALAEPVAAFKPSIDETPMEAIKAAPMPLDKSYKAKAFKDLHGIDGEDYQQLTTQGFYIAANGDRWEHKGEDGAKRWSLTGAIVKPSVGVLV